MDDPAFPCPSCGAPDSVSLSEDDWVGYDERHIYRLVPNPHCSSCEAYWLTRDAYRDDLAGRIDAAFEAIVNTPWGGY